MKNLLNVWYPASVFEHLSKVIKNPVIFALFKDGKPTLEMLNCGDVPKAKFEQFMFLELPIMEKPVEFKAEDAPLLEKLEEKDEREENSDSGSEAS